MCVWAMPEVPFFRILRSSLPARRSGRNGKTASASQPDESGVRRILIVGNPNVGKSVLFNRLTGRYVVVSNYPGTTVEVSRGRGEIDGMRFEVVDTPGMYSLRPLSEEERVGRAMLLKEAPWLVIHVVDAKNLERMLPFTLQLMEAQLPVVLVANMKDEADSIGVEIDTEELGRRLGIPCVPVSALRGEGLAELRRVIGERAHSQ